MPANDDSSTTLFTNAYTALRATLTSHPGDTLPAPSLLAAATSSLPIPASPSYLQPLGPDATLKHLRADILPALTGQNLSARYLGFVTGSTLPVAEAADNLVSALDANVQVHLPRQTVATEVEDCALRMLLDVLRLRAEEWGGRTFTTGATASNVLGLAMGREAVVEARLQAVGVQGVNVSEAGLLAACTAAWVKEVQVLTSMAHSSVYKAAAVVGLGRASVKECSVSEDEPWRLDVDAVERELRKQDVLSIIAISAGEVNTGRFATTGNDMRRLRSLADKHGAWIHVDGAFGIFARTLEGPEFEALHAYVDGLELADSITADGHKLLNVPYDCGIFFSRHASLQSQVFQNPNAAYLASDPGSQIQSPLNIGLENSRRFRALPVYAVLLSEGREGLVQMFSRMVVFARRIAEFVRDSESYQWLPDAEADVSHTNIIVLFRAKDDALNDVLVEKINETRLVYVSGTKWKGQKACRIAVSSWRVDVEKDLEIVVGVLKSVAESVKS